MEKSANDQNKIYVTRIYGRNSVALISNQKVNHNYVPPPSIYIPGRSPVRETQTAQVTQIENEG